MRGNENEGETYWVRTGLELAGVVSERVLTQRQDGLESESDPKGDEVRWTKVQGGHRDEAEG